jgi:hypothetical protein
MKIQSRAPTGSILSSAKGFLLAAACAALFATKLPAAVSLRERLSWDAGWKFHLGDDWSDALRLDKAGVGSSPAAERFPDSLWRDVQVPHDWAIELPFDSNSARNHASVAIWSIANEELGVHETPRAERPARAMQDLVKRLDRPRLAPLCPDPLKQSITQ